ncbi:MAG: YkgJ family cysteine cluster protein [Candidatus Lokiarchaeota archaeon]|nr:YkgJ family cysteine cluster protein [Candidatus Lokiarchaeota archaeon]
MKYLRFTCIRCGNCCTDKNTLINLTYLDILRIKNGLDFDLNELLNILGFYTFDKPLTSEDKKRMTITPMETERKLAFIGLLKNSLGACYFYNSKDKRCLIYSLRPMFCRTFPFSFESLKNENDDTINAIDIFYTEKGKEYCPGIGNEAPLIEEDYWIELGRRTLEELKKNQKIIEQWNNSVKNGKITPTVKKFLLIISKITNY